MITSIPQSSPEVGALGQEFRRDAEELLEGISKEVLVLDGLVQESAAARDTEWAHRRDVALRLLFQSTSNLKSLSGTFGYLQLARVGANLEDLLRELRLLSRPLDRAAVDSLFVGLESLYGALRHPELVTSSEAPRPAKLPFAVGEEAPTHRGLSTPVGTTHASEMPLEYPVGDGPESASRTSRRSSWLPAELEYLEGMLRATSQLLGLRPMVRNLTKGLRSGVSPQQLLRELREINHGLERHAGDVRHALLDARKVPVQELYDRLGVLASRLSKEFGRAAKLSFAGGEARIDGEVGAQLERPLAALIRGAFGTDGNGFSGPQLGFRAFAKGGDVVIEMEGYPHQAYSSRLATQAKASLPSSGAPLRETWGGEEQPDTPSSVAPRSATAADELVSTRARPRSLLSFAPGESTNDALAHLRAVVGRLGGLVRVSRRGDRTATFALRVPASPSMFRAMVLGIEDQTVALPLHMILAVERLRESQIERLTREDGREECFFAWRDERIALYRFPQEGDAPSLPPGPSQPAETDEAARTLVAKRPKQPSVPAANYAVVLQGQHRPFAMWVERIFGEEEVTVEPLGEAPLRHGFAMGTTRVGCLEDGSGPVQVIDPQRLVEDLEQPLPTDF